MIYLAWRTNNTLYETILQIYNIDSIVDDFRTISILMIDANSDHMLTAGFSKQK
jgi:hypothetical protein